MRQGLLWAISALLCGFCGSASAGVQVTFTSTDLDTKEAKPMVVYADAGRLKIVNPDTTIIYRGDQNKAWVINTRERAYTELTPAAMQQMAGQIQSQLSAAQAQIAEQLASLPPEQRARIQALLGANGLAGQGAGRPASQAPQVAYAKAGPSRTIANVRCDMYRKTLNGEVDEDVCIAPIAAARLTANDFKVLESFSGFMQPMGTLPQSQRSDYMDWNAMNRAIGFQGMPMETVHYLGGKPSRQETVQNIERINIPANTYDLPAGLTKREFPSIRR